jgi:hypothetical protein
MSSIRLIELWSHCLTEGEEESEESTVQNQHNHHAR